MKFPINIRNIYRILLLGLLQPRLKITSLAVITLILSIIGGRAAAPIFLFISNSLLFLILIGISLNFGKKYEYPIILYLISLSLLFGTTLQSNYLIGSDIHIEYYFARLTQLHGWEPSLAYNMNGSLSVTLLAPFLSDLFHIDIIWIFKVVFPILFAGVPVILYLIYRQFISNKAAFLAAAFFAIIPTYFMELTAVTRQQIATLFFVIMIYFIVSKEEYLPAFLRRSAWMRVPFILLTGVLAIVSHYTTGALAMGFVGASVILVAVFKVIKIAPEIPLRVLSVAAVYVIVLGICYYAVVSSGTALHDMIGLLPGGAKVQAMIPQLSPEVAPPQVPGEIINPPGPIGTLGEAIQPHSQMMQLALGMDFGEATGWGKLFRVIQLLTQLFIVIGMAIFLYRAFKERQNSIYTAFILICAGILAVCVIDPVFSQVINASRFYQYALIFIAPGVILTAQLISRKIPGLNTWAPGYAAIFCLLVIPYAAFNTGVIFEATKQTNIMRFDMPYSIALSSHRLDLWGNYTPDDEKVRLKIALDRINPILTDIHGRVFLQETLGYTREIYLLPQEIDKIPDRYYVFLRAHNVEAGMLAYWVGPGLRAYVGEQLPENFEGREVIYQSGDSILLGQRSR